MQVIDVKVTRNSISATDFTYRIAAVDARGSVVVELVSVTDPGGPIERVNHVNLPKWVSAAQLPLLHAALSQIPMLIARIERAHQAGRLC